MQHQRAAVLSVARRLRAAALADSGLCPAVARSFPVSAQPPSSSPSSSFFAPSPPARHAPWPTITASSLAPGSLLDQLYGGGAEADTGSSPDAEGSRSRRRRRVVAVEADQPALERAVRAALDSGCEGESAVDLRARLAVLTGRRRYDDF